MLGRGLTWFVLLLPLLAGCVTTSPDPARAACQSRMEKLSEQLLPGFAAAGYRPTVVVLLDDKLFNGRGFPSAPEVLGDSMVGGRVRLRPQLCDEEAMAVIVMAHEMAHIALNHHGTLATGVNLAWETPRHEAEADALALTVLKKLHAPKAMLDYLTCRLGQCAPLPGNWKRKPVGSALAED